ncbi:MAG: hypothetical protein AAF604_05445 [Acidobacteriota bacterium]
MRTRTILAFLALTALWILAVPAAQAAPTQGDWTLKVGDRAGEIELGLTTDSGKHRSQHYSTWAVREFEGIGQAMSASNRASFALVREAGRIDFEGRIDNGRGSGTFRFTPSPSFARSMESLDFEVDDHHQFGMALQDVTLEFARQMRSADLEDLDSSQLIAFRFHGVSLDYIEAVREAGQTIRDSKKLVAFRVHGIQPDWIRSLHRAGYEPSNSKLVAMKVHGVTIPWIEAMAASGIGPLPIEKLIAFRVHQVTPEMIAAFVDLGYGDLDGSQLVAFRVHDVSPEFVRELDVLGLEPAASQLIAMRIHQVTPEFVRGLRDAGAELDISGFITAKIQGVTPESVAEARRQGLRRLDLGGILDWHHSRRHSS